MISKHGFSAHKHHTGGGADLSFLDKGFFEDSEKKIIRSELIEKYAHDLGKQYAKGETSNGKALTPSQLRNFFNDVRSLEAKVKAESDFSQLIPHIKMLKAKVAYAFGRGNVPREFKELISKCVSKIESKEDFQAFVKFFEAIVGYFYGEGGGRNR